MKTVTVIGAGLAGSEAAWQLAKRGIKVRLYEMRPEKMTPAHHTGLFAELVCSNSLRSNLLENAAGLLKEEMRRLDSLIIKCADNNTVPAGSALAVDREGFARQVTRMIEENHNIEVIRQEVTEFPEGPAIIATGPLTSDGLAKALAKVLDCEYLYFYDAASPIVTAESLDMNLIFRASRYGKAGDHYLNCPFTKEEYEEFWSELVEAETYPLKQFEDLKVFEGCMPVEVMAKRGKETLLYGPLRPVGLTDPRTGRTPCAVVQLRQDNARGTLYNLVGFQTNLRWSEQNRVFRMIPGLKNAEFVRYGVMHRNTYINSPRLLLDTLQLKTDPSIMFAGQITGVEGYIESTASGLVAGIGMARMMEGKPLPALPRESIIGSLIKYITSSTAGDGFQPMNANFGLLPPLEERVRDKKRRNRMLAERSLEYLDRVARDLD
ncbi:MAG TPA: methylenetetrahydrofolate--tRNA-(uracil(54)-C(5))-methyltransferase (FADH(2)-oxidizing) TrmFO [Clostridia bacterium]|nr:methylenetetrahydrofolate--tRNA-(uracil(54)-C(5))-methyltransferase (FADH(2)-oxidizing) TrmFO [Clostridia bacterium]